MIVLVCCSFTYVTAQIYGTGLIASRFLGMQFEIAVFAGLVGILLCAMLGGMRAVTWTQIAQYIVLIVAYLTPIVILSTKKYGIPIPELTYGQAIAEITAREGQMMKDGLAVLCTRDCRPELCKPHIQPFINYIAAELLRHHLLHDGRHGVAAAHPDALFHHAEVREARQSVAWSLLFIFLLYFSAPAYAAFSKLEVYTNIIGSDLSDIRPWLFNWGELGLIQICGKNAANLQAVIDACKAIAGHPGVVRLQDFVINTDVIVLSTPEIAGLPYVISGLVAAGGLAAALSTADGLLLAIANALSHDVYYKMIDPNAPTIRRLHGRPRSLGVRGGGGGRYGRDQAGGHSGHGGLGVLARHGRQLPGARHGRLVEARDDGRRDLRHDRRVRPVPVLSRHHPVFPGRGVKYFGMTSLINPVTGKPLVDIAKAMALPNAMESWPTLAHPLANKVGWFDLNNINCGLLGMPLGFLVIYVVSLIAKEPSKEMQAFVDEIRKPRGRTVLEEEDLPADAVESGAGPCGAPLLFDRPACRHFAASSRS